MAAYISQSQLAKMRNVSRQSISNAIRRGSLIAESDGTLSLERPENAAFLLHQTAKGRPVKGTVRASRPKTHKMSALQNMDDGEELPPEAFTPPDGEGSIFIGRLGAQRKRVIAACRLFQHKIQELKNGYCKTELYTRLTNYHLDKLAALTAAADLVDWNNEDPVNAIDQAVDTILDTLKTLPDWLVTDDEPTQEPEGDNLDSLTLDELRGHWDELHALRHSLHLADRKGEIIHWQEVKRHFSNIAADTKILFLDLGRRVGSRLSALAKTEGNAAASNALRRELADAVSRFERHRLTSPG